MSFTGQRHTESALKKCSEAKIAYWLKKNGTPKDRFLSRISRGGPDECWPWTSSKTKSGYGKWSHEGTFIGSHRLAFEMDIGYLVPKGLEACHHCDNRACCNPSHIYVAMHKSNMQDASIRKRWAINPSRKTNIRILRSLVKERVRPKKITLGQRRENLERSRIARTLPMPEKFWFYVNQQSSDECWLWLGTKSNGYGEIRIEGTMYRANRLAWELTNGRPIENGLVARHTCDTPACCNPSHIIPGTKKENVQDCIRRGRKNPVQGERHPRSVLTESKVREIKRQKGTVSIVQAAKINGVSCGAINGIYHGRNWKHVI